MTQRNVLFAILCLVAAPVLAGCAENDGGDGTTNPTTTSPTTTTPGGSPTPSSPTGPVPTLPATPTLNLNLKLGVMMPITGELSSLGPDMRDGALMAIEEVNAANTGLKIEHFIEDDKTSDSAAAPNTFNRLAGLGVTAVAGPCCSGVTNAILDLAVQNEIVVASPSATSPALTMDRENDGFFWRVSPSDAVQGKVLANLVKGDNVTSVNLIVVNNAYGTGLATVFEQHFKSLGGAVGRTERFNEGSNEFSGAVSAVCGTNAQGLVLVMYIDNAANLLKALNQQNCLGKFKIYGSEGIYNADASTQGLPQRAGQTSNGTWLAAGIKGTHPESGNLSVYNEKFRAKYNHDPAQYSAESYDAVVYLALAAIAAKSVEGTDIAENLAKIANGGTKCNTFTTCAALLIAGRDIDYQGQAHDFNYDERHEPETGIYAYWRVGPDGTVESYQRGQTA